MIDERTALAVDPGGTIGWVQGKVLPLEKKPILTPELKIVAWGETVKHQEFLDWAWDRMQFGYVNKLIIENFFPTGGIKSWQPDALHQIGTLQWMARHMDVPVFMQAPGDRKFATADKLAPYPQVKGPGGHAKSALMHLVTWRWMEAGRHGR